MRDGRACGTRAVVAASEAASPPRWAARAPPPSSTLRPLLCPRPGLPSSRSESGSLSSLSCCCRASRGERRSWNWDFGRPPAAALSCPDCFVVSHWNSCRIPIFDFLNIKHGPPRPLPGHSCVWLVVREALSVGLDPAWRSRVSDCLSHKLDKAVST